MWNPQVPALAERFRVVRYDARGHGRSPAPEGPYRLDDLLDDVVALLDRLEVERASFVGLSLGGMTGMLLAARHPERVDRLGLLCTSAHFTDPSPWLERSRAVREHGTASVAAAVVQRWFTAVGHDAQPALVERCEAMVAGTSDHGYAAWCDVLAGMDLRPALASITAPTLVLGGAQDPATPPAHQQALAEAIAGARLEVLDGAAHLANLEQPGTVTALLLQHLAPS